jgi:hypothetical protein
VGTHKEKPVERENEGATILVSKIRSASFIKIEREPKEGGKHQEEK